jgi:transposase
MNEQTLRKTYQYKRKPTPEQEQALGRTLMLCRQVYNAAFGERREAWHKCSVTITYYQQQAELLGSKKRCQSTAKSMPRSCRRWCCA